MEKEIFNVLKEITKFGYKAYIIGGYPRDKYLNNKSNDIDICTSAKPFELKQIFPNIILRKYGSCLLSRDGLSFEITTFRKDIGTNDNRNPKDIEYVDNLFEDLQRRDFIINTLAIDINNNYIDLLGARSDIDNKIIRTVKNPNISLEEDALRILRAIRFSLQLGFKISSDVEEAMFKYSYLLDNVSKFYIKRELDKIVNYEDSIFLLNKYGLDKYLEI